MRVRHNHTAYCYPHKHTEIFTPTPYWTFLSPWIEHDARLWDRFKQVLKFPNTLGPQSTMLRAPFSPVLNVVLALFPFRGHMVSPTQYVYPLRAASPILSRDVLCKDAALGSLLPPWCSRGVERTRKENGWKLSMSSLSGQNRTRVWIFLCCFNEGKLCFPFN